MTCLNLSVSTLLKLHFRRKYIKHPKHIQDIQLNTSDMLAATHIELSHTNSNIFATFNEWINLAEQKKCSKKGPLGSNFCTKKKKKYQQKIHCALVPEQFYSDMHSAITI